MQQYPTANDIWLATGTATSYMAVIVHYVGTEWRLQYQIMFVPEDLTAENLATV